MGKIGQNSGAVSCLSSVTHNYLTLNGFLGPEMAGIRFHGGYSFNHLVASFVSISALQGLVFKLQRTASRLMSTNYLAQAVASLPYFFRHAMLIAVFLSSDLVAAGPILPRRFRPLSRPLSARSNAKGHSSGAKVLCMYECSMRCEMDVCN